MAFDVNKLKKEQEFYQKDNHEDILLLVVRKMLSL